MLQPKRTKYRKYQKGCSSAQGRAAFADALLHGVQKQLSQKSIRGKNPIGRISSNTSSLSFGQFGLKSLESGRIKAQVLEAARRTMNRKLRRHGKIWIRLFPSIPVTEKPAEVRMGKGKGNIAFWVSPVSAGQIIFELDGMTLELAKQATCLAARKIPFRTEFVQIS